MFVLDIPIETIEITEDRQLFANCLAEINEKVAPSARATNVKESIEIANKIGYPILLNQHLH